MDSNILFSTDSSDPFLRLPYGGQHPFSKSVAYLSDMISDPRKTIHRRKKKIQQLKKQQLQLEYFELFLKHKTLIFLRVKEFLKLHLLDKNGSTLTLYVSQLAS